MCLRIFERNAEERKDRPRTSKMGAFRRVQNDNGDRRFLPFANNFHGNAICNLGGYLVGSTALGDASS